MENGEEGVWWNGVVSGEYSGTWVCIGVWVTE
jgi:hypothetical protein